MDCIRYLYLDEVKEELDKRGIKYKSSPIGDGESVWVTRIDQIENPTRKEREEFSPSVRITHHKGFVGYYVKECGCVHENQSMESVLRYINQWCL